MASLERTNVHLLLVEDTLEFLEELIEWLHIFGYQQIETAGDATEARAKLDEKPFDLIVTDMWFGSHTTGGFNVLDEVNKRSITSVVIILTANDDVMDCRRAFKEGAWDYIPKNMQGNPFELLDQSIREAITYFNLRGSDKDKAWIEENMTLLLESYDGQHIAVLNNSVIAAAESEETLKQQLRDNKYPVFMPIIRKIGAESIAELIALGESTTLEFKSTLQWDVRQNKKNEGLQFPVLKTINAFLNSEWSTLLIGVEDNGNIFGLAQDLSTMTHKTLDRFELHLMNLIGKSIGSAFSQLLKVRFEEIEGKQICVIEVKRAPKPVFMKKKNQKLFHIRRGNGSLSLDIEEAFEYIQMQWK